MVVHIVKVEKGYETEGRVPGTRQAVVVSRKNPGSKSLRADK